MKRMGGRERGVGVGVEWGYGHIQLECANTKKN